MVNELYIDVYMRFCKLAATDDKVFKTFKSHPDYVPMLEHVSEPQGFEYLQIIKDRNPQLLDRIHKFRENDKFGAPNTFEYVEAGILSPTTLRYIKMLGGHDRDV